MKVYKIKDKILIVSILIGIVFSFISINYRILFTNNLDIQGNKKAIVTALLALISWSPLLLNNLLVKIQKIYIKNNN